MENPPMARKELQDRPQVVDFINQPSLWGGPVKIKNEDTLSEAFKRELVGNQSAPDLLCKRYKIDVGDEEITFVIVGEHKQNDIAKYQKEAFKQVNDYIDTILEKTYHQHALGFSVLWDNESHVHLEFWWRSGTSQPQRFMLDYLGSAADAKNLNVFESLRTFLLSNKELIHQPTPTSVKDKKVLSAFLNKQGLNIENIEWADKIHSYSGQGSREVTTPYIKQLQNMILASEWTAIKAHSRLIDNGQGTEQKNEDKHLMATTARQLLQLNRDVHILTSENGFYWFVSSPSGAGYIHLWSAEGVLIRKKTNKEMVWEAPLVLQLTLDNIPEPNRATEFLYAKLTDTDGEGVGLRTTDSVETLGRRIFADDARDPELAYQKMLEVINSKYTSVRTGTDKKTKSALRGEADIVLPYDPEQDGWFKKSTNRSKAISYYETVGHNHPEYSRGICLDNSFWAGKPYKPVSKVLVLHSGTYSLKLYNSKDEYVRTINVNNADIDPEYIRSCINNEVEKYCKMFAREEDSIKYPNIPIALMKERIRIPVVLAETGEVLPKWSQRLYTNK